MRQGLTSIPIQAVRDWVKDHGLPSYRAGQILKWAYGGANSFDDMSNLPKTLRDLLEADYFLREITADRVVPKTTPIRPAAEKKSRAC